MRPLPLALTLAGILVSLTKAQSGAPPRPQGPCDIYAANGAPCVAAHSTTRALYAAYNGPLYQVLRQSDGKTMDIGVARASASPVPDPGGYAEAAAQDAFCAGTACVITAVRGKLTESWLWIPILALAMWYSVYRWLQVRG